MDIVTQAASQINLNQTLVKPLSSTGLSPERAMHTEFSQAKVPGPFSLTLDNSAGVAVAKYIIGDPDGLIAGIYGGTLKAADSGTVAPAAINKSFGNAPVIIGRINVTAKVSETQFAQPFEEVTGDIDGTLVKSSLNLDSAKRSNDFNGKLLTIDTSIKLGSKSALVVSVAVGETVSLTCTPVMIAKV